MQFYLLVKIISCSSSGGVRTIMVHHMAFIQYFLLRVFSVLCIVFRVRVLEDPRFLVPR